MGFQYTNRHADLTTTPGWQPHDSWDNHYSRDGFEDRDTELENFLAGLETLSDADFRKVLDARYAPIIQTMSSFDTTTQTGGASADFTYDTATITLTPGTWIVTAGLTLLNTVTADAACCAIWNNTAGAEVAGSRGAAGLTSPTALASLVSMPTVITAAANTVYRPRGRRNGASTIQALGAAVAGAPAGYITAWRIG